MDRSGMLIGRWACLEEIQLLRCFRVGHEETRCRGADQYFHDNIKQGAAVLGFLSGEGERFQFHIMLALIVILL